MSHHKVMVNLVSSITCLGYLVYKPVLLQTVVGSQQLMDIVDIRGSFNTEGCRVDNREVRVAIIEGKISFTVAGFTFCEISLC